jgi:hypothetical protein
MKEKDYTLSSLLIDYDEAKTRCETYKSGLKEDCEKISNIIKSRANVGISEIIVSNPNEGILALLTQKGFQIEVLEAANGLKYKISWY